MNTQHVLTLRQHVLNLYAEGLSGVDARASVAKHLQQEQLLAPSYWLLAIGKAAPRMAQGAFDVLGDKIARGLVISKEAHCNLWPQPPKFIHCREAGHPYPDARSLQAGEALLQFLHDAPDEVALLVFISGGSSALVEVLPAGVHLDDLRRLNQWLLAGGLPIDVVNRIRKSVSCIKAGRLAWRTQPHRVLQFVISDVPGDHWADIGSGLLLPDDSTEQHNDLELPLWIQQMQHHAPSKPHCDDACFHQITTRMVANNAQARHAIAQRAHQFGYTLRCNSELTGDALLAGATIARQLQEGEEGAYLYGGETVVNLPAQPGHGGRCQSLALSAALALIDEQDVVLLAAGTDGTDGPTQLAGAIVDGQTCWRGADVGMDAREALQRADAGTFLQLSGDLIDTGPTGTNVMDLVIAIKSSSVANSSL